MIERRIDVKADQRHMGWSTTKCLFALILFALLTFPAAFALAETGDVNGDGTVDARDSMALRGYLVGNPGGIHTAGADLNGDSRVDLRDLVLLERLLETMPTEDPPVDPEDKSVTVKNIVYGQSESGRDLVCTVMEPKKYSRTILVVFAIHGFEDSYPHDGQELVDTAGLVIGHFQDPAALSDTRLMIVAPANPDGLYDGTTNYGFGRCNANGIDLNRDFDAAHVVMTNDRNRTPYPFSASESRALRDLVAAYNPDVVLDCHGWENCTIGDSELAAVFQEEMGLQHRVSFSDNAHGYFSYWTHNRGALALLVEFTNPDFDRQSFLSAMDRLARGDYDDGTGEYESDPAFEGFSTVNTYTLSTGDVFTYLDFDGNRTGKIFGNEDLCTILKFYRNGYVRVRYPVSAGQKEAYCPLDAFIAPEQRIGISSVYFQANQAVYRRMDLSETIGTVYSTDSAFCVARTDSALQIIYPLDAGGWKMGWVPAGTASFSRSAAGGRSFLDSAESDSAMLDANPVQAVAGRESQTPVSVRAEDLVAARLWLIYDPSILTLEGVENGECLNSITLSEDQATGVYCMLWADSLQFDPRAVNGTLAIPVFSVPEGVSPQNTTVQVMIPAGNALDSVLNEVALDSFSIPVIIKEQDGRALYLPDETVVIEAEAFAGCSFETIYLTSPNLSALRYRAFADCTGLRSVYIGPGVTEIDDDAFAGCVGITVHGESGSAAEVFAVKKGIVFIPFDFENE